MRNANRILLVASMLLLTVSDADASLFRRRKAEKKPAETAMAGLSLTAVEVDGSRILLRTSGTPAYTSYSPSPLVYVIDLTSTQKAPTVAIPESLPPAVASIAAEEAIEMGTKLTRITFRFTQAVTPEASASENMVAVSIPMVASIAPAPVAATAEMPSPESVPTIIEEPIAAQPPASAPVQATASPAEAGAPMQKAKRVKSVETWGSGEELQVLISGDGVMTYKAFRLTNPERLVVDLTGVRNGVTRGALAVDGPVVQKVRVAQFQSAPQPITRVVFDLNQKTEFDVRADGNQLRVLFGETSIADRQPPAPAVTTAPVLTVAAPMIEEVRPAAQQIALVSADIPSQVPTIAEEAAWKMPPAASSGARKVINSADDQAYPTQPTPSRNVTPSSQAGSMPGADNVFADQQTTGMPLLTSGSPVGGRTLSGSSRVYTGEPLSLNLKDADIKDVLRTFAQLTGLNIAVDPQVSGSVTVDFVDVPWDQALDLILRQNGLTYVLEGNVMRVGTIDRIAAETTATRRLAEEERLNVPLQTLAFKLSYARATEVAALLREIASPRARIIVDARTNQLIISEIPQFLSTMRNLIDTIDVPTSQVVIEARIVETTKQFTQQYGFNWGFRGALDPALGNGTGLVFPNRIGFVGGPFTFTGGAGPVLGLSLTDVLGSFTLDLALHAAELETLVKVIGAPKVTTQDNTAAEIQSGLQIPYQTRVNFTTTVQYIDATLRLSVTPQITQAGTIIMDIQVQNTTPGGVVEGAAGAALQTRQARTRVMVRDGGTAVIGGIYRVNNTNSVSRIPFVHQIPLLGNLFKSHNISSTYDELLIFITPRIIRGA